MVSVILLVLTIVSAYVVVIAGSIAYELTGLDHETAHFQALSAFTGTGFTTRVAERVVNNPVRRRITIALILLGYAGTATVVASLVTSVNTGSFGLSMRNLGVLVLAGLGMWYALRRIGSRVLGDSLRRFLARRMHEEVPHEELILYKEGFGVSRIEVPVNSRVSGRRLRDIGLRDHRVQVLAIEDGEVVHAIPDPDWVFQAGQHVVLYGALEGIHRAFRPWDGTHSDRPFLPGSEE
jgi:hypothetical protein